MDLFCVGIFFSLSVTVWALSWCGLWTNTCEFVKKHKKIGSDIYFLNIFEN